MDSEKRFVSIKGWAEDDRPREKVLEKGLSSLSDAELIAIMIGSGTRELSAVALAQDILRKYHNNLNELGRANIKELMHFKGIGEAKAISIAAALEIGRRRQLTDIRDRPKITSSNDAFNALCTLLSDNVHEEFWILLLNRANQIIGRERISSGGVSGTVADAKIIFRQALLSGASSIILSHNHPSGNLQPSQADIELTKKLREAGKNLDIIVLDHLIIAGNRYFSFGDEGIL